MSTFSLRLIYLVAATLCASAAPWSDVHADYHQTVGADSQGSVEIVDVAGSVEIEGWERPEVEVAVTPEDLGQRVRMSHSGDMTSIHVEPYGSGSGDDIHLVVHVPAKSSVSTTLVSADLKVKGLQGEAYLRSISGGIGGEVDGNVRVNTVTGTVHLSARAAKRIEVKSISGGVHVSGGSGEAELTTVSGTLKADLGALSRGRFRSVSGDLTLNFSMAPDAEIEGESVSGTIRFGLASVPAADIDVQSFSGSIDNCFGPKPTQAQYGPGSKLAFKSGDGHGSLRIATKSGDVKLCTAGPHVAPAGYAAPGKPRCWREMLYVI
jgi:hypothetical protein